MKISGVILAILSLVLFVESGRFFQTPTFSIVEEKMLRRKEKKGEFFDKLFKYLMTVIGKNEEELMEKFIQTLMKILLTSKSPEEFFQNFVTELMEFVKDGFGEEKEGFLEVIFAEIFQAIRKKKDQPERRAIDGKFSKYFESFFKIIRDLLGGEGNEFLTEFLQRIFEFFADRKGLGKDVDTFKKFLEMFLNLGVKDKNSRRIIKKDCLPIEIDEKEVKCKEKDGKTKCEVKEKKKDTGADADGHKQKTEQEYEYEEEYKITPKEDGKIYDDKEEEKHEVETKEKVRDDYTRIKHKEEHKFEGQQEVADDDGIPGIMKYKVKCKYKYYEKTFKDKFVEAFLAGGHRDDDLFFDEFFRFMKNTPHQVLVHDDLDKEKVDDIYVNDLKTYLEPMIEKKRESKPPEKEKTVRVTDDGNLGKKSSMIFFSFIGFIALALLILLCCCVCSVVCGLLYSKHMEKKVQNDSKEMVTEDLENEEAEYTHMQ